MFPNLFSIGPLTFHTYGLFVALGFFAGLMVTIRIGKSEGIAPQIVMDMGFIIILSAIIGSRLLYVLLNISGFSQRPLDIFKIWEGGLVFSGGVIVVIPAILWYVKRHGLSWWKVADLWAPAAALGQAFGRIGCFMAGCCHGKPTDQKWGVVFTNPESLGPLNVFLHPTQLYSSISGFIIFFVLMLLRKNKQFDGRIFLWFLIIHSTARLAIERFRGDDRGIFLSSNMTITQLVTTLILIASVVTLLALIKSKAKEQQDRQENKRPQQ